MKGIGQALCYLNRLLIAPQLTGCVAISHFTVMLSTAEHSTNESRVMRPLASLVSENAL